MSYKRRHQDDVDASNGPPRQKRQFTDKDRQRATIFDQLADDKHGTRIQAAKKLIDEFAPSEGLEVEKLQDVLNRLIKGLCSGRKSARAGYFMALSELLRQTATSNDLFEQVTGGLEALLKMINQLTRPDRNSPQENRDKHIGRVVAYKAFLQSSILKNAKSASEDNWNFFISQASKQAQSNPWLREECGSMLCEFITSSAQEQPPQEDIAKKIIEKYAADGLLETAEGVALWLTTQKSYPDLKLPKDIWHKRDPLHSSERTRLARILVDSRGSTNTEPEQQGQKKKIKASGTWKPQPNFAWRVVMQRAFTKCSSTSKLQQFCIEVLDNSLFAEKASSERKLWGFSLNSWAIRNSPVELLPALFTPGFMRSLINHRVEADRDLFVAAQGPLDAIVERGEKDSSAALTLFDFLLTSDISSKFDSSTKSNTLSRLAGNIAEDGKSAMINAISDFIIKPSREEVASSQDAHNARVVFANLLVGIIARHAKHDVSVDDPLTRKAAHTLATFAYLRTKDAVPSISEESRDMFHEAVIRCLSHILPKLPDAGEWLTNLVKHIQKSGETSKHRLILQADDSIAELIITSHTTLKSIRKIMEPAGNDIKEPLKILQILFSLTLLEAYSGDTDAVDMLSELQTCFTSINDQETKSQAFDLLVELLLSFLAKTSSLYRQIGEFIFPVLAEGMSGDGLESLLDILATNETVVGQGELFESANAEEEVEDGEDDDDNISIDSDVEFLSGSEDEADGNNKESGSNEDDSDGEDTADPELQQFNDMLAQTLKTQGADAEDEASEAESDMDDDQMMALDPQITKIFQERRKAGGLGDSGSKKKEQSKAKLQMTLFKSRVLDLLQTFVKKQHARPSVFNVVLPLLSLMRSTTDAELEKKAKATLGAWIENCDRNKGYPVADDIDETWSLLRAVHDEVQKQGSKQHAMICARLSLFIAKLLMQADKANLRRLIEEYGKTQLEVIENGTPVQPAFFAEWCGWTMQWKKSSIKEGHENVKSIENGVPGKTASLSTDKSEHQEVAETNGEVEGKAMKKSKKKGKKSKTSGTAS